MLLTFLEWIRPIEWDRGYIRSGSTFRIAKIVSGRLGSLSVPFSFFLDAKAFWSFQIIRQSLSVVSKTSLIQPNSIQSNRGPLTWLPAHVKKCNLIRRFFSNRDLSSTYLLLNFKRLLSRQLPWQLLLYWGGPIRSILSASPGCFQRNFSIHKSCSFF